MEYTLTMTFIIETGEKTNISISDVREDVSEAEVQALMNSIIENAVFYSKKGNLVSKSSAQLTERQVTKFNV